LARVLRDSKVGTIFVTDTKRTHDTAAPLGKALGITPVVLPARDTDQLAKKLLSLGVSETALVVGHSNTVPAIVKALGSETPPMSDSEFDRMLVITTGGSKPAMLTLRYGR
jgi:phosphohistidine phosphatase SixA